VVAYYLDDRLSLAEGTCRFAADGSGRETVVEGFYALAIRRSGYRECLFRFSGRDRVAACSMLGALNGSVTEAGSGLTAPGSTPER